MTPPPQTEATPHAHPPASSGMSGAPFAAFSQSGAALASSPLSGAAFAESSLSRAASAASSLSGSPFVAHSLPSRPASSRKPIVPTALPSRTGDAMNVRHDFATEVESPRRVSRERADCRRHAVASMLRDANLSEKARKARAHNERVKRVQERRKMMMMNTASASERDQSALLGKEQVRGVPKAAGFFATPARTAEGSAFSESSALSMEDTASDPGTDNCSSNRGLLKTPVLCSNPLPRSMESRAEPLERWSAARRIAGYWLLSRSRATLSEAGLLGGFASIGDFESTITAARTNEARLSARLALRAIGANPDASPILVFSIVAALHKDRVFLNGIGEVERSAILSARRMILCMQAGTLPAMAYAWGDWTDALASWRAQEMEALTAAIVTDGIALEALRVSLHQTFSSGQPSHGSDEVPARPPWDDLISERQKELYHNTRGLSDTGGPEPLEEALTRARENPDECIDQSVAADCDMFLSRLQQPRVPNEAWNALDQELRAEPRCYDELGVRVLHIEANARVIAAGSISSVSELPVRDAPVLALQLVTREAVALLREHREEPEDVQQSCLELANQLSEASPGFASVVVRLLMQLTQKISVLRYRVDTERVLMRSGTGGYDRAPWERSRARERVAVLGLLAGDARPAQGLELRDVGQFVGCRPLHKLPGQ